MKTISWMLAVATLSVLSAGTAFANQSQLSHATTNDRIHNRCAATCTVVDYFGPVNKLTNVGNLAWEDVYEEHPGIEGCRLAAATACAQPNFPCRFLKIKVDLSYDLFPDIGLPAVTGVIIHRCAR